MAKKQSLVEIHVAVVLFGLAGLFGKWLVFSPLIIVLGRVFFASLALLIIFLFSKQSMRISPIQNYALFILLGFILAVHWVAFFQSIQISTVAIGLLSYSSFPVFTAFLEPLFFREKIDLSMILLAFFCVIGIFLIIPRFDLSDSTYRGVLWGLLAGFTFSVLTILNRRLSQKYSSLLITFYQDFWATVFLLPFFFSQYRISSFRRRWLLSICTKTPKAIVPRPVMINKDDSIAEGIWGDTIPVCAK